MIKKYLTLFSIFISLNLLFIFYKIYCILGKAIVKVDIVTFLIYNFNSSFLSFRYTVFSLMVTFLIYLIFFKIKEVRNYYKAILVFLFVVFTIDIFGVCYKYDAYKYIFNKVQTSDFYEKYYVDAKTADIKIPENKKNLILIVAESMEFTFADKQYCGADLIPELSSLAKNNISFTNYINGYGQNNTMMSFTAMMTGIPSNGVFIGRGGNNFFTEQISCFLPKIYSLPKILKDNNYQTLLVQGSSFKFAGLDIFCKSHNFDKVYDLDKIRAQYSIQPMQNWWGLEDKDTFDVFKKEIFNLDKEKPFFAVMFTINTHFTGNLPPFTNVDNIFNNQYFNVIKNSSFLINEFVSWSKKQSFSQDTVVVIAGDHLRMGNNFNFKTDKVNRTVYNVFINSEFSNKPVNKDRLFVPIDLFPTMLESIGFKIKNSKLGLGTSLFSDRKTLLEEFGEKELNYCLSKKNKLYDSLWRK